MGVVDRVRHQVGRDIPVEVDLHAVAPFFKVRVTHLGDPGLDEDQLAVVVIFLDAQRVKRVLVQPVQNARGIVTGEPIFTHFRFNHVARHPAIGRVGGIVLPHGFDFARQHVVKCAVGVGQGDGFAGSGEADSLV